MRHLLPVTALFSALAFANPEGPPPELVLSNGTYRLEGRCVSMTSLGSSEVSQCKSHMGIVVGEPNQPSFMFPRIDGGWLFETTSMPSYTSKTASFPVKAVLDTSTGRAFDLPGECVITNSVAPIISCNVQLKSGKKLKEVSFEGTGTWAFSKEGSQ